LPAFGDSTAALLKSVDDASREHRAIAATFCNEVAACLRGPGSPGDPVDAGEMGDLPILVFDDFHAVQDAPAVNGAVDCLLQWLPPGCHVVLASRMVPAHLNLARLAGRRNLGGMGVTDLRFRSDEAKELIQLQAGRDVAPEEIAWAVQRAEGWVTALLLTLFGRDDWRAVPRRSQAAPRGEPAYDYLATQAFENLPSDARRFLMESAILPSLSADECDAVLDRTDSAERLADVVRMGLFVEPLATEEWATTGVAPFGATPDTTEAAAAAAAAGDDGWLRYHGLWRAFLLDRLQAGDSARTAALRRRAAQRALQRGDVAAAVEHLFALGGDGAELAQALLSVAERELAGGHAERLLGWISRLPGAATRAHPSLLVHAARALRRLDRVKDGLEKAKEAEQQAQSARQWDTVYLARAWRAELLALLGQGDEAVAMITDLFEQLHRLPRPGDLLVHFEKEACVTLGYAGRYREAIVHGTTALLHLSNIEDRAQRLHIAATLHHTLAICADRLNQADEAEARFRAAERLWKSQGDVLNQARVLSGLGLIKQRAGERAEAAVFFRQGLALAEHVGHASTRTILLNNLARCQREQGLLADAQRSIDEALPLARDVQEGRLRGEVLQEAGLVALRRDNVVDAVRLLEEAQEVAEQHWHAGLPLSQALLALAHARGGRRLESARAAAAARAALQTTQSTEGRLRVLVAAAAAAAQQRDRAVHQLRLARRWARDRGVLPAFFAEVGQYPETARLAMREKRLPSDVRALLRTAALNTATETDRPAIAAADPADPADAADAADAAQNDETLPDSAPTRRRLPHRPPVAPGATGTPTFELRLFGVPTLLRDGSPSPNWRTHLVRDLLCFLALHADTVVRSEKLVDRLLPNTDYERGITAVRHAVYHLRRLFAPHNPVRTLRGGYRLALDETIRCDAMEFDRLLERGPDESGSCTQERLERAIALFRGPLLDGIDATWALAARADAEHRFLDAWGRLRSIYDATGQHEAALAAARRALAIDPLEDEFHLAMLRHLVALGRGAAALQHYRYYRHLVRTEANREPHPDVDLLLANLAPGAATTPA
jgi:ATP/maltotriose-dependent transcriptional regulator MalT/DNA-binding SARP family transcriptional activator